MKPALSLISKVIPEMDRQSSRKPWPSATRGKHDCARREVNRNTQLVLGSKANSWDITRWTLIFSYFASQISAIQAERIETKYSKMWKQESALPKNILSGSPHLLGKYWQSTYYCTFLDTAVKIKILKKEPGTLSWGQPLSSTKVSILTHCHQGHMAPTPNCH